MAQIQKPSDLYLFINMLQIFAVKLGFYLFRFGNWNCPFKTAKLQTVAEPLRLKFKYWNAYNDYVYNSYELEQSLVDNFYFFCSNLKDYFFTAISNLNTSGLPQYKIDKVQRVKDIVAKIKEYEASNMPISAESEVKKIIPEL